MQVASRFRLQALAACNVCTQVRPRLLLQPILTNTVCLPCNRADTAWCCSDALPSLTHRFSLCTASNRLGSPLPAELSGLSNLTVMGLDSNGITGGLLEPVTASLVCGSCWWACAAECLGGLLASAVTGTACRTVSPPECGQQLGAMRKLSKLRLNCSSELVRTSK